MHGLCTSRPDAEILKALLQNKLDRYDNRVQTVGSDKQNNSHDCPQQFDTLIENLLSKTPELTHHHYMLNSKPDI
jgi:hypothetical protein